MEVKTFEVWKTAKVNGGENLRGLGDPKGYSERLKGLQLYL